MTALLALVFFAIAWLYAFYIGGWDPWCDRLQNVGLIWLAISQSEVITSLRKVKQ